MSATPHYRRAYRALVARLGLDEAERRDFNLTWGGHESSSDFDDADWAIVVAELQRLTGREGVQPGKPHLRGVSPYRPRRRGPQAPTPDRPFPLDFLASAKQVAWLEDLAARITWRTDDGARRFVAATAWPPAQADKAARWLDTGGGWQSLPREVAAVAIRRMSKELRLQQQRGRQAV